MRLTYRTSRVLGCSRSSPGVQQPRGRRIRGDQRRGAGLEAACGAWSASGLLANAGAGHAKGEPNAWRLTAQGEQVVQRLQCTRIEEEAA